MIDQILAEIGIEGGSLSRMPGIIREARDMQGIRKETAPKRLPDEGGSGGGSGSSSEGGSGGGGGGGGRRKKD
jgi:hypothetical protein